MRRVNFRWNANPESDVAGYKIHCGPATRTYTDAASPKDVGNVTSGYYDVADTGTFYFALTVYDSEVPSNESAYSDEVIFIGVPLGVPVLRLR